MNITQGNISMLDLVNKAYKGEAMLPDFQRNFVWPRNDIEELIESLLDGMFIGTFLILETNSYSAPFKTIFVTGAEKANSEIKANPRFLILDGQQRLTALFYTVYAPDVNLKNTETPYAFFMDLDKLLYDNVDEAVFSWSKKSREYISVTDGNGNMEYSSLINKKLVPLTMFSDANEFYSKWYQKYVQLFDQEQAKKITSYLENILKYQILTLNLGLSYNDKPEEIAKLFEKINRTGIKLSPYDLLAARLYKFIKLREEWEISFKEKPNIKKLAIREDNTDVPYSFIQALALANDRSIKSSDLIRIDEKLLNKETWDRAVDLVDNKVIPRMLNIARYGMTDFDKWLPYFPTITLMTAFNLRYDHPDIDKIDMWYWSSVFSERYSGSTETLIMRDFREISQWLKSDDSTPEVVNLQRIQLSTGAYSLRDVKRRSSSKYRGVFNLLFRNNAKDFFEPDDLSYNELEDHHIFPKKFLEGKKVKVDYDTVLNRTLIFDKTNKRISDKSPAEYMRDILNLHKGRGLSETDAEAKIIRNLEAHFIDADMYKILKNTDRNLSSEEINMNFERFIDLRERMITKKIEELIGSMRIL